MTQFIRLMNGRALYQENDKLWVAKGRKFFAVDYNGNKISKVFTVPGGLKELILTSHRILTQGTRNDIRVLLPLNNGNIMIAAKKKVIIFSPSGDIVNIWSGFQGNKPGHQGACITPDGTIFFAEYILNTRREHPIRLWRSKDQGITWNIIKEFTPGDIRHLHFIKWDKYEKCLWLGSGDYGKGNCENRLYKSIDNGDTWTLIGQGSQDWRAVGVCFTKDYLLWGTDAGSCPEMAHFVRMDRSTLKLKIIENLEGPCHGCASYNDGRSFFSTGVEGGENEKDNYARLKEYRNGKIETIWQLKKDIWPLILQYGVIRFPLGTDQCSKVIFTAMGLRRHGETIMIEE